MDSVATAWAPYFRQRKHRIYVLCRAHKNAYGFSDDGFSVNGIDSTIHDYARM